MFRPQHEQPWTRLVDEIGFAAETYIYSHCPATTVDVMMIS